MSQSARSHVMNEDFDVAVRDALSTLTWGCHGIVTVDGEQDACGKPATVLIDGRHGEADHIWPACTYHGHRYGGGNVVPLRQVIAVQTRVVSPGGSDQ